MIPYKPAGQRKSKIEVSNFGFYQKTKPDFRKSPNKFIDNFHAHCFSLVILLLLRFLENVFAGLELMQIKIE